MDKRAGHCRHFSSDDLIKTLVETADLDSAQLMHLESCRLCRQQAENVKRRYQRLGQMAREMTPKPTRAFRLPVQAAPKRFWQVKPAVALAFVGAVVFIFAVWMPRTYNGPDSPLLPLAQNDFQDARLLQEIDALVDDALPVPLQYVAVASEPIWSQDLIDWIVPSIDGDDEKNKPRA